MMKSRRSESLDRLGLNVGLWTLYIGPHYRSLFRNQLIRLRTLNEAYTETPKPYTQGVFYTPLGGLIPPQLSNNTP